MTISLLTESEARRQWGGELMVVREDRTLLPDFAIISLRAAIVLLLTMPIWRTDLPVFKDIHYAYAVIAAAACYGASWLIAADLKAARGPCSWLMAASRERVWVHFRSYRHNHWPVVDKTVLMLERADIERFHALRFGQGVPPQLAIVLDTVLLADQVEALMFENTREDGATLGRRRYNHQPVRLEKSGQVLRVMFGQNRPNLGLVLDKLRLSYDVDPPRSSHDPEQDLLPNEMLES